MRIALRLFGHDVLDLEVECNQDPEPEHGPPFGFSGSAGLHAELAGDWAPAEEGRTT